MKWIINDSGVSQNPISPRLFLTVFDLGQMIDSMSKEVCLIVE